jgi:hypothetical protein
MTQDRLWIYISAVALVVVAAVWLWFLFAYADNAKAMTANHPRQRQPIPTTRLWPSIVAISCVAIVAAGALVLIGWISLALLGY